MVMIKQRNKSALVPDSNKFYMNKWWRKTELAEIKLLNSQFLNWNSYRALHWNTVITLQTFELKRGNSYTNESIIRKALPRRRETGFHMRATSPLNKNFVPILPHCRLGRVIKIILFLMRASLIQFSVSYASSDHSGSLWCMCTSSIATWQRSLPASPHALLAAKLGKYK